MKNKIIKAGLLSCSLFVLASCGGGGGGGSSASAGEELDLSTFVAVGDSLTAGFADGSLYFDGQLDSYPNIVATSFAQAGGGTFTQPFVADNLGGLLLGGAPIATPPSAVSLGSADGFESRLVLPFGTTSPTRQSGTRTTNLGGAGSVNLDGPFNNLGVPGARIADLTDAALVNPFYSRFASNPGVSTILTDATSQVPTFFSLWIGNNDVLDFGTSGGVIEANDASEVGQGAGQITPVADFETAYNSIVNDLTAGGASGVLINIPAITDIPFFTTVPTDAIELDAATAATVSAAFVDYNAGIQGALGATLISPEEAAARTIVFQEGNNGVLIIDEALTVIQLPEAALGLSGIPGGFVTLPNFRQTTSDDLITLIGGTGAAGVGVELVDGDPNTTVGVAVPLGFTNPALLTNPLLFLTPLDPTIVADADSRVLTAREIQLITEATDGYNAIIRGLASSNSDLVLYDAAADLADLGDSDGISFGSGAINSGFITGGGFSLDGVHPTATGYAVIANGIIDAINSGFSANLNEVDPNVFSRNFFSFPAGTDFSVPAGFSFPSNGF